MPNKRTRWLIAVVCIIIALVGLWIVITRYKTESEPQLPRDKLSSDGKSATGEHTLQTPLQAGSNVPLPSSGSVAVQSAEKRSGDKPLFVIEGRVLSAEGDGLTGARLEVLKGSSAEDRDIFRRLTAEKDGSYRLQLDFVRNEVVTIKAEMQGFSSAEEAVQMHDEGEVGLDFVLSRENCALSGRVVDYEGKGVAGAEVRIEVPHRGREALGDLAMLINYFKREAVYSSANGNFFFGSLSPGPVGLEVIAKDYLPHQTSVELKPGKNTVEVRLKATEKLEVRVSDRAGQPVANANISSLWLDSLVQAQTKADGVALLPIPADVVDEEIELGVKARGFLHAVVKRRPRATRVEVVLSEAPQLVGKVMTESGKPIEGCRVMTQTRISGLEGRQHLPAGGIARTDQDGRFTVEAVERGRLSVSCNGFPSITRTVRAEDAGRDLAVVVKDQDSALIGQVVDPSGQPVTGFWISLEQGGGGDPLAELESEGLSVHRFFHDPQGRFSFPAISAGVWMLTAWSDDGALTVQLRAELLRGQATEGLVVRLKSLR